MKANLEPVPPPPRPSGVSSGSPPPRSAGSPVPALCPTRPPPRLVLDGFVFSTLEPHQRPEGAKAKAGKGLAAGRKALQARQRQKLAPPTRRKRSRNRPFPLPPAFQGNERSLDVRGVPPRTPQKRIPGNRAANTIPPMKEHSIDRKLTPTPSSRLHSGSHCRPDALRKINNGSVQTVVLQPRWKHGVWL